mmetsp:Transcript_17545/g.45338  ORF Transcript_17545/g.45338 Transcript_17545/m.45338 type:complete len:221 (-) Transcript_17545:695-1357(-)
MLSRKPSYKWACGASASTPTPLATRRTGASRSPRHRRWTCLSRCCAPSPRPSRPRSTCSTHSSSALRGTAATWRCSHVYASLWRRTVRRSRSRCSNARSSTRRSSSGIPFDRVCSSACRPLRRSKSQTRSQRPARRVRQMAVAPVAAVAAARWRQQRRQSPWVARRICSLTSSAAWIWVRRQFPRAARRQRRQRWAASSCPQPQLVVASVVVVAVAQRTC